MLRRWSVRWILLASAWTVGTSASESHAATATFTPVGMTHVEAGTDITFQIAVAVTSLSGFNTADVIIGSNAATDLTFAYSVDWLAAFSSVTTPQFDVGFYDQSVFVGGNHSTSVGTSLLLGTVTIHTAGMPLGNYRLDISNTLDGFSTLGLDGQPEPLNGFVTFAITPPIPAVSEWGLVLLALSLLAIGTVLLTPHRSPANE